MMSTAREYAPALAALPVGLLAVVANPWLTVAGSIALLYAACHASAYGRGGTRAGAPVTLAALGVPGLVLACVLLNVAVRGPLSPVLTGPSRYVGLAIAVAVAVLLGSRTRFRGDIRPAEAALGLLLVYGVVGTAAALVSGGGTGAIALYVPIALALVVARLKLTEGLAEKCLLVLAMAGTVYVGFHFVYRLVLLRLGHGTIQHYSHEAAFIIAMTVQAHVLRRSWLAAGATAAAALALFAEYPAATYVMATAVLASSWVLTRSRRPGAVLLGVSVVGFLLLQRMSGGSLDFGVATSRYFASVGKSSNADVRMSLWSQAINQIRESPWVGTLNMEVPVVPIRLWPVTVEVPPHNDMLQLTMAGGVVATALFVFALGHTLVRVAVAARGLTGTEEQRRLAAVLFTGQATFVLTGLFNPLLSKVDLACVFFALLGLSVALLRARKAAAPSADCDGLLRVG